MFKTGTYVVYKNNGLCFIEDIRNEKFGSLERQDFYVLKLIYENGSVVYVPVAKEEKERRMREPLKKEQVQVLLEEITEIDAGWIADDKMRSAKFHDILEENNPAELIKIIKMLYRRSGELSELGKKMRSADAAVMKKAENNLYGEIAFALGIKPEEALRYITEHLEA